MRRTAQAAVLSAPSPTILPDSTGSTARSAASCFWRSRRSASREGVGPVIATPPRPSSTATRRRATGESSVTHAHVPVSGAAFVLRWRLQAGATVARPFSGHPRPI